MLASTLEHDTHMDKMTKVMKICVADIHLHHMEVPMLCGAKLLHPVNIGLNVEIQLEFSTKMF